MSAIPVKTKMYANQIFDAIQKSSVMAKKGYKILYARDYSSTKIKYGICFTKQLTYIHLRIDKDGHLSLMFQYGNKQAISIDLQSLVKELESLRVP